MKYVSLFLGALAMFAGTAACGGGGAASITEPPTDDGGVQKQIDGQATTTTTNDASSSSSSTISIYPSCAQATAKPLTAGSIVDRSGTATLHWPAPWTQASTNGLNGAFRSYTYVPTNATAAQTTSTTMTVDPSGVSSDAQGEEVLKGWVKWAKDNAGDSREITVNGHKAVLWWSDEPPAQPGCANCPGDPGPNNITIGLAVYVGAVEVWGHLMIEVRGSARVNADPADIFCDMQAMALGTTFSR